VWGVWGVWGVCDSEHCTALSSRRISRQLPQLELQYVSPKLLLCRDLELAPAANLT
jgi:hypothetical protein